MMEEPIFILFTIVSLGILLLKLANVLTAHQLYSPKMTIVLFVGALFSYLFILISTLWDAGSTPVLSTFLSIHTFMLLILIVLTVTEVILFFVYVIPQKNGYGSRERLIINRMR